MSIFSDIFSGVKNRGASSEPVVHNNPHAANPGQPPNPRDRVPENNPNANPAIVPGNNESQPTNKPNEPISPLDTFKDIWQPPKDAKGEPIVQANPLAQPLITNDPVKFAEQARKMNFAAGLEPALVAKALGGDVDSLMQVLNQTSQNAFMSAAQLSTSMVEGATKTNNSRFESVLEQKFKEYLVGQERTANPILSHEAVSPMLDMAKQQLMRKHPDKSASEIQQMAETMMGNFAEAFTGNKTQKAAEQKGGAFDPYDFSTYGT